MIEGTVSKGHIMGEMALSHNFAYLATGAGCDIRIWRRQISAGTYSDFGTSSYSCLEIRHLARLATIYFSSKLACERIRGSYNHLIALVAIRKCVRYIAPYAIDSGISEPRNTVRSTSYIYA